jgi:hypothetical protein
VLFEKPGRVVVSYDARKDYVLFDWSSFNVTLDEIQTLHQKALDGAKRHNCRTYIADTSKVRNALPQDVVGWWSGTWVPVLAGYGLRTIVTVLPTSAVANMSTTSWQRQVVDGIATINVTSLAEAESAIVTV